MSAVYKILEKYKMDKECYLLPIIIHGKGEEIDTNMTDDNSGPI